MAEKLLCPICGEPTRVYMGNARKDRLCSKHADMLKKEEIYFENNDFFDSKTKKSLTKKEEIKQADDNKPSKVVADGATVKCISCGREIKPGYFFCGLCYGKYKDKEILVRISKCTDIELLDESYEGKYICADGHIVKSKSEMIIDNYLFERKIAHAYEKALPIDENPNHNLHPDFCLPKFANGEDVYIEHWGYNENNIKYTKTKAYKVKKYEELGYTVICTNENDMSDYQTALDRKLKFFKPGIVNDK